MHSRIFQVSMEPIDKDDYIEESYYYDHWFTNSVADYVSDDCDRKKDIQWLKDCVNGIAFGYDDHGVCFVVKSKEEYFSRAFDAFKNVLERIKDCTIEEFATGIDGMWKLKDLYEEKFGFYVDADGELMAFDSFVRHCTVGRKYYIGGTVDYHA